MDTGDPASTRFPRSQGDPAGGPRILCVDDPDLSPHYEQWYTDTYPGGPNISWNIYEPNYLCNLPESPDPATWTLGPGGHLGLTRDFAEVIWHRVHMEQAGLFDVIYCTSSVDDSRLDCSEVGALQNFVYSTFPVGTGSLKREMIRQGRSYSCPDCEVPN